MAENKIELASKFVDLILPRMVVQHAEAIKTNLDGIRLILSKTDDPRLRSDLEMSAGKLEKFLNGDVQNRLHDVMVNGFAEEFTSTELKNLIKQEELNIRVQAVANKLEEEIEKILN